jgi:Tol biopolymer transport system component
MNADGKNQTILTNHPASDGAPSWSPDGKKIAFHSGRDGETSEIYVMDADGGNVQRLTDNTVYDLGPVWSPDGKKIAFYSDNFFFGNDIFVMNADGSNRRRLTHTFFSLNMDPSWCCQSLPAGESAREIGEPSLSMKYVLIIVGIVFAAAVLIIIFLRTRKT